VLLDIVERDCYIRLKSVL